MLRKSANNSNTLPWYMNGTASSDQSPFTFPVRVVTKSEYYFPQQNFDTLSLPKKSKEKLRKICLEHPAFFWEGWGLAALVMLSEKKPTVLIAHSQSCPTVLVAAACLSYKVTVIELCPPAIESSRKGLAWRYAQESISTWIRTVLSGKTLLDKVLVGISSGLHFLVALIEERQYSVFEKMRDMNLGFLKDLLLLNQEMGQNVILLHAEHDRLFPVAATPDLHELVYAQQTIPGHHSEVLPRSLPQEIFALIR